MLFIIAALWLWTLFLAVEDFRTYEITNFVMLAIAAGVAWHSRYYTWASASAWAVFLGVLYVMWRAGGIGGGDLKLWAMWFAWTPPALAWQGVMVAGGTMLLTALLQAAVTRKGRKERHPAAWRTLLYGLWLVLVLVL